MSLQEHVSRFMDLYWESDWTTMRSMVTEDFVWENRPSLGMLLSFDQLVKISSDFIDGKERWSGGRWPAIDEGHSIHLRSVESGNHIAQERMAIWRTNGRWFNTPCFGFWTFRSGLISSWNDYFDMKWVNDYASGALAGEEERWSQVPDRRFDEEPTA